MLFDEFTSFFYNWPTEPKPPIYSFPIYKKQVLKNFSCDSRDITGYEIQMALAGFTEKDVEVWHEDNVLHIQGNNKYNDSVFVKFKSSFHHKISCVRELSLKDSDVTLQNGILKIEIPINEEKINRKYLLSKKKK